ncbi:hypothetical protein ACIG5E_36685 [Kitasatospora sp. NPDC053057]|uniref:hypothetical protein n=1 Tax=Kitasatospora sp. NPDC053057 TaxID=3364062 RepID=UPI0037CBFDF3
MLLDGALLDFRFARLKCVGIAAAPPVAYQPARDLDLLSIHSPLFNAVTWARGLPERSAGTPRRQGVGRGSGLTSA